MPELSKEELEELAEKAAAHASALTGQHAAREVGKEVGKRMEEATGHHSPISSHCEDILGLLPLCGISAGQGAGLCAGLGNFKSKGNHPGFRLGGHGRTFAKLLRQRDLQPPRRRKRQWRSCAAWNTWIRYLSVNPIRRRRRHPRKQRREQREVKMPEENETPVYAENIKHVEKLVHENPNIEVLVAIWNSGAVTSCVRNPEGIPGVEEHCYSTDAGQEEAGWSFIYNLSQHGFREYHVETE